MAAPCLAAPSPQKPRPCVGSMCVSVLQLDGALQFYVDLASMHIQGKIGRTRTRTDSVLTLLLHEFQEPASALKHRLQIAALRVLDTRTASVFVSYVRPTQTQIHTPQHNNTAAQYIAQYKSQQFSQRTTRNNTSTNEQAQVCVQVYSSLYTPAIREQEKASRIKLNTWSNSTGFKFVASFATMIPP